MKYTYKKSKDGNHFYRIGENILHAFLAKNDHTVIQESEVITITSEIKKNDCCINVIDEIHQEEFESTEEEFESTIREVIFILGIYEFVEKNDF